MARRVQPQATKRRRIDRFVRNEDGAALVEFALVLPMMIFVFAVIVEGSRIMFAYQSVIGGVRDAARYLARVAPGDICATGGTVSGYAGRLYTIVAQGTSGGTILPASVTVNSVTPSLVCVTGTYRVNPTPVATVSAEIAIDFPFGGLLSLVGHSPAGITTTVSDTAKVFGT